RGALLYLPTGTARMGGPLASLRAQGGRGRRAPPGPHARLPPPRSRLWRRPRGAPHRTVSVGFCARPRGRHTRGRHDDGQADADAEREREIRAERKFSLSEDVGRMAGPGMMKGVSPVTRKEQAAAEIQEYLSRHLADAGGVLSGVLLCRVAESDLLLGALDQ